MLRFKTLAALSGLAIAVSLAVGACSSDSSSSSNPVAPNSPDSTDNLPNQGKGGTTGIFGSAGASGASGAGGGSATDAGSDSDAASGAGGSGGTPGDSDAGAECGNGSVEPGEQCDDGDANVSGAATPGGGCSTTCTFVPECIGPAQCGALVPHCVDGMCVECEVDDDCTEADASHCNAGVCSPCRAGMDEDCAHISGKNVCLNGVTCAECAPVGTSNSGSDTCSGNNVCDAATGTCTNTLAGSSDLCGLPVGDAAGTPSECIATAQCKSNYLCADLQFGGESVGHYCLPQPVGGTCNTNYMLEGLTFPDFLHFNKKVTSTTIEGDTAQICVPSATTCYGLIYERAGVSCETDDECGQPGVDDALCDAYGSCEPRCEDDGDCLSSCVTQSPGRLHCSAPS